MQKIKEIWQVNNDSAQKNKTEQSQRSESRSLLPAIELIGASDDRGVRNVGGRLGAAHGPTTIRNSLEAMAIGMSLDTLNLLKGYDVPAGKSIEEGHMALRTAVTQSLKSDRTPIVLGGGHDYGFPHLAGVVDFKKSDVALINIDAHLDVRPPNEHGITSGSPFFLAIESGVLNPKLFFELGIQDHCNTKEAQAYLTKRGATVHTLRSMRNSKSGVISTFREVLKSLAHKNIATVVSFDLDAVSMAWAPGVSAPQIDGLTAGEMIEMARICGEYSIVRSIGFFELAPPLDECGKTARLAATAIHQYSSVLTRGVASGRKPGAKTRLRRLLRVPKARRGL